MSTLALFIWGLTIAIVALVIVPVALSLLGRALTAARNIETYLADMLEAGVKIVCLLYTSPSPRDATLSRMPSSA